MTKGRIILFATLGVLVLALGWLFLWPVPFDPVAYSPGPNPAGTGIYTANGLLAEAELVPTGEGPEGVALDAEGNLYTGLADGRIMRYKADGSSEGEEIANTGGRPLGLEFDPNGNLIIADAAMGLLSMSPDGAISVLTDEVEGTPIRFADDLAITSEGVIWFSDASTRHVMSEIILELFESRPSGRLLRYDPASGATKIVLKYLSFANGVALSADERFLLVNESYRYRVTRYWIKGELEGTTEVFIDNLPGYPDNITEAPDGGFWLAIPVLRNDFDNLLPTPFWRKVVWRLTQLRGISPPEQQVYAVKFAADGTPVMALEDSSGHYRMLTSVLEWDGKLYLGSIQQEAIGVLKVPEEQ